MNSDFLYSCVIDSTWVFLGAWLLLLVGAGVQVFRVTPRRHPANQATDLVSEAPRKLPVNYRI